MNDSMENNETKNVPSGVALQSELEKIRDTLQLDTSNAMLGLLQYIDRYVKLTIADKIENKLQAMFDVAFDQYDKALQFNQLIDDRIDTRDLICRDELWDECKQIIEDDDQHVRYDDLTSQVEDTINDMNLKVVVD